ncbi:hypothetical protein HMI54_007997 [Coelomomyces lativittatus]|nr:hypothetical protein HMI56_005983 [Coelomomyces lativittatus]KAJ1516050.1 hypothetical protein HMI55_003085 [Coelomomyces lativittatus]KAJ1516835.1 hypothetical protein HMI54_007997 [Coelomomyces lativittatus]
MHVGNTFSNSLLERHPITDENEVVNLPSLSVSRKSAKKRSRTSLPFPSVHPHPWGILPLGNLLFDRQSLTFVDTRKRSLGLFSCFDDSFILGLIVEYFNPRCLAKLAQVSKVWACFSYFEEIWKGWVLSKWRNQPDHLVKQWINGSWRQTYISLISNQKQTSSSLSLQIPYFYSDLHYHPHYYAHFPLEYIVELLESSPFVSVLPKLSNPDISTFADHYEKLNLPCILQNSMYTWNFSVPMQWDELSNLLGETLLQAEAITIRWKEYAHYLHHPCTLEESPVYVFDKAVLHSKTFRSLYSLPIYFQSDLFSVLGSKRPDHAWLIVGPKKSGSTHHKDPNSTSAWNAVLKGRKLWILYPPDLLPPGVYPSDDQSKVHTPVSLMDWWINWFPQTVKLVKNLPKEKFPQWGICEEGEIVFVPNGWWHTVINLEASIAITQNYVSVHNLKNVLHFLNLNRHMVSGYNETEDNECISSTLYEDFVCALKTATHLSSDILDVVQSYEKDRNEKSKPTSSITRLFQEEVKDFSLFGKCEE